MRVSVCVGQLACRWGSVEMPTRYARNTGAIAIKMVTELARDLATGWDPLADNAGWDLAAHRSSGMAPLDRPDPEAPATEVRRAIRSRPAPRHEVQPRSLQIQCCLLLLLLKAHHSCWCHTHLHAHRLRR